MLDNTNHELITTVSKALVFLLSRASAYLGGRQASLVTNPAHSSLTAFDVTWTASQKYLCQSNARSGEQLAVVSPVLQLISQRTRLGRNDRIRSIVWSIQLRDLSI